MHRKLYFVFSVRPLSNTKIKVKKNLVRHLANVSSGVWNLSREINVMLRNQPHLCTGVADV